MMEDRCQQGATDTETELSAETLDAAAFVSPSKVLIVTNIVESVFTDPIIKVYCIA